MTTKNAIVDFLLKEERALMLGLFFLPFRNALMKGATMDEEAVAYIRKLRWGAIILGLVFFSIAVEPFFNEAMSASDALLGFILVFLAVFGLFVFYISLLGYQHRDVIPTDKVAMFDLNVAKSGGLWGALGLGIWSLFKLFFAG